MRAVRIVLPAVAVAGIAFSCAAACSKASPPEKPPAIYLAVLSVRPDGPLLTEAIRAQAAWHGFRPATTADVLLSAAVAHAQDPTRNTSEDDSQKKAVDELLAGTRFIPVDKESYRKMITHERVVLFFYSTEDVDGPNGRLATVLKALETEYRDIVFISYKEGSDGLKGQDYLNRFSIKSSPFLAFFQRGRRVFELKGGPKPGFEEKWIEWLRMKIREHLGTGP